MGGKRSERRGPMGGDRLDGDAQRDAVGAVEVAWTRQSPVEAAKFAASLPSGSAQDAAVRSVLIPWANTDPGAAASWVSQFPAGELRDQSAANVVIPWAQKDASGAADWLQSLDAGSTRDAAVGAFVSVAQRTRPGQRGPPGRRRLVDKRRSCFGWRASRGPGSMLMPPPRVRGS